MKRQITITALLISALLLASCEKKSAPQPSAQADTPVSAEVAEPAESAQPAEEPAPANPAAYGEKSRPTDALDIVFADGTATAWREGLSLTRAQKEAAVAVIFYRGTECSNDGRERLLGVGLAGDLEWLCLHDANAYSVNITPIQCDVSGEGRNLSFSGDLDGSDNFEQIRAYLVQQGLADDTADKSLYPGFYFCKDYAQNENSHVSGTPYEQGWYIPSIAELHQYEKVYQTVGRAIALCGGRYWHPEICFWSSSQSPSADKDMLGIYFSSHPWYTNVEKCGDLCPVVCAIRDFSGDTPAAYGEKSRPTDALDIVFADGTATAWREGLSLTQEQKEAAVAVIFYRGTECSNDGRERLLGVGLAHQKDGLAWCTEDANAYHMNITTIQCDANGGAGSLTFEGDLDGSDNLSQIAACLAAHGSEDDTADAQKYPAFHYAKNYAAQAGSRVAGAPFADGWYLPTIAELFQIWKNREGVDAASGLCGGDVFGKSVYYWSSSQRDSIDDHAFLLWFVNIYDDRLGSLIFSEGELYSDSKRNDQLSVCAIRDFSGDTPAPAQTTQPQPAARAGSYAYSGSDDIDSVAWYVGSEKQAVVLLSFPPHFDFDRRAAAFCSEHGIFFSVINAKIYGGEYDCALFAELLEDWK